MAFPSGYTSECLPSGQERQAGERHGMAGSVRTPKDIHSLELVSVSLYGIRNYADVIKDFEMEKLSWFIRRQREV